MSGAPDEPATVPSEPVRGMRWSAVLSLGSGVVNQLALLVTGILAARALGPDGRGTQALFTLLPIVLSQVGTLGLPSAVVYFVGASGVSPRSLARLLRRPAAVQSAVSALVQVAVLLVIAQFFHVADWGAALVTVVLLPMLIAHEYATALMQGQHRLVAFQVLRSTPNVLYALALAHVVTSGVEVGLLDVIVTWILALAAGTALTCAVAWRGLSRDGRDGDARLVARMRSFGRRSFLGAISPLESLRVDQLIAGFFLGPAALGLYVSAAAFTGLTRTMSQSIGVLAYPDVARRHRAGAGRGAVRRGAVYLALITAATTAIALVVILTAPWLVTVTFGPEFADAAGAARILIVAGALLAVRRVAGDVARGMGRAAVNSWAEGATLAALVAAFLTYGNQGSAEAAAWAVLAAAGCGVLVLAAQVARRPGRPAGSGSAPNRTNSGSPTAGGSR
ncbi:lipopolysaccharide biosynthesis protein [Modestobacter marinus]|uniref:lipopolysaccharide biosynthesis protein n=1 Tax=Modestobacter marinus TaxID=477641 RepID=UPI001C942C09|nr:oligosaccharide flippase family protein [Modestobacter marinus]